MKKTLYVTDLDGTLMRDDKSISEYTKNVLNTLIERGEGITFATARSIVSAGRITKDIRFRLPVITKNGSVFANQRLGTEVEVASFTPSETEELTSLLKAQGLCGIVTEQRDGKEVKKYFTGRSNRGLDSYLHEHREDKRMLAVDEEEGLWTGTLTYIVFIGEKEELEPVYCLLKDNPVCSMVFQKDQYLDDYWIELFPKEASKANAILKLKERYGYEEVVCFGDSINDLSMFALADRACAVKNALEEVKAQATEVIGSNEEDGVARWLSQLL